MSVVTTHAARAFTLVLELPGADPANAGVLLEDPSTNELYVRLRRDWDRIAPEEAEILAELEADLEAKAIELGAAGLLAHLQDTLSNILTISEPRPVMVDDFERALHRLYSQTVISEPQAFRTHLPRYSLSVAAGRFLDNQEVAGEEWVETPPELRLTKDMFVARIQGHSMEPRIPDGSLCVFRAGVTGSRQGRLVLVEELGRGGNDRYTVKRYTSVKRPVDADTGEPDEGKWAQVDIVLEPLNPAYEAFHLDPSEDRYRILAEFVAVLY